MWWLNLINKIVLFFKAIKQLRRLTKMRFVFEYKKQSIGVILLGYQCNRNGFLIYLCNLKIGFKK